MKKISVIVPIYHGKQYIESMIHQIETAAEMASAEAEVELIFSNDAPDEKLECYSSPVIKIVTLDTDLNRGIHGARVRGLEASSGEFVLFLDQDDKISKDYFKSQIVKIEKCDATVCDAIQRTSFVYAGAPMFEEVEIPDRMLKGNCIISPGQVLLRKDAIPNIWTNTIMENNGADDWLLWLCMQAKGKVFKFNQDILFEHMEEGYNASLNYVKMQQSELEVYDIMFQSGMLSEQQLLCLKKTIDTLNTSRLKLLGKYGKFLCVMELWLKKENRGEGIVAFLKEKNIHTVAIYGFGYIGRLVQDVLINKGINVEYLLDQNAKFINADSPIYTLNDEIPKTEAVIVTMLGNEKKVLSAIREKMKVPTWSLSEIIEIK